MSLYDEMLKLERAVDQARGAEGRVEAERRPLVAKHARARGTLEAFYARGSDDKKTEAALKAAVKKAEAEVDDAWEARLVGARMSEGLAREELHAFVAAHFAELASELVEPSRQAGERFTKARQELVEALEQKATVLDRWRPILGAGGIAVSDLPPADSLEPPMPRSLVGLVREETAA